MPSVILAGTTTGTALSLTSDTSGELQIRTNNGATTAMTLTTGGNINIPTLGARITGDFSNATVANRVAFQTSTTNSNTSIPFFPNGTGTVSGVLLYGGTDPTNTNFLQVLSNGTLNAGISGTGTYQPITIFTGGSERLRINTSGNVVIGNTSAPSRLNIAGAQGQYRIDPENASGAVINFTTNLAANAYVPQIYDATSHAWRISGNTGAILDSSGNVGIGTTSTGGYRLNVSTPSLGNTAGNTSQGLNIGTNTGNQDEFQILWQRKTSVGGWPSADLILRRSVDATANQSTLRFGADVSGGTFQFDTAGTERMRITSGGDLLVGATGALGGNRQITCVGASTSRGALILGATTQATNNVVGSVQAYNGTQAVASIDLQSSAANNSGSIQVFTWSVGTPVAGPFVSSGGNSWTSSSDETLKDIIEPIENSVQKVLSLRAVIGKFKTDPADTRRSFLIAQDVQAVLPEAISEASDGTLGLSYTDVIPLLVASIKELKAELDSVKAELQTLKGA
jgi:hypothetical protein